MSPGIPMTGSTQPAYRTTPSGGGAVGVGGADRPVINRGRDPAGRVGGRQRQVRLPKRPAAGGGGLPGRGHVGGEPPRGRVVCDVTVIGCGQAQDLHLGFVEFDVGVVVLGLCAAVTPSGAGPMMEVTVGIDPAAYGGPARWRTLAGCWRLPSRSTGGATRI